MNTLDKAKMTAGLDFKNSHERDSIASALFAFSMINGTLQKIERAVYQLDMKDKMREICKLVISKNFTLSKALEMTTEKEEEEIIQNTVMPQVLLTKEQEKIKQMQRENLTLRKHNIKLIKALGKHKTKYRRLLGKKTAEKTEEQTDNRIVALLSRLKQKEIETIQGHEEIRKLNLMLANTRGKIVAKKLENLSWEEYFQKKRELDIKEGDVLLVRNPSLFNQRAIDELKGKISVILHIEPIGTKTANNIGMVFIQADKIAKLESRGFALIDKADLEKERSKTDILSNIVDSYKKERQQS